MITVTPNAVAKINDVLAEENNPNLTIPNIEDEDSILNHLSTNTYTKLNDQTVFGCEQVMQLFNNKFAVSLLAVDLQVINKNNTAKIDRISAFF